ncbi:MAG TPA: hypothetical protein DDW52_13815 [Planctomycetaceae bacterium]|nr:hypothetical protein [Planctomycetaceae bacterium]
MDFGRDIRPILSDKCIFCHGPDEAHRGADLRLDLEEAAKEYVIAEHNAAASELISRIESTDLDEQMPPPDSGKSLTEAEKELLREWIEQGAVWTQQWAYELPVLHPIPKRTSTWPKNWIDDFVVKRMPEGVKPNSDAEPITLVRRLYFDLTGLPPTPKQVSAFLADDSSEGYSQVVDELLDSPHFGERLAMYWLDLVRYADTVGYHGDQDHNISPYRDWVITALNDNMPFDQFTREQLAGDLLDNPTLDQKIASGYNRLLQTTHEGGLQPKEYIAIYAADRVRNVSAVWMGGTLGCAQCHNHKYDPYTLKDFYSMAAFFADLDDTQHFKIGTNALPTRRPPEIELPTQEQTAKLAELTKQLVAARKSVERSGSEIEPGDEGEARAAENQAAAQAEIKRLQQSIKQLNAQIRRSMISVALAEPRITRVLPRGNWLDESGPVVQPAVPEFMRPMSASGNRATRLDLANWLVDSESGVGLLTARVMVNRFWYLMVGNAIAADLDDFGGQGTPPVAPKLLDNLAIEFVRSGWDIKHMFRIIANSRTYQQSSIVGPERLAADPNNQWFSRASRYRLPAEMIRDSALKVSGLLHDEIGGASARPYQPVGYYRHLNFPKRKYDPDTGLQQYRRGVYVHWQRQFLHPMLKSFDAPTREECTAERPRSNTPLAALTLLNDPTFVEAARAFAGRVLTEANSDFDSRLGFAYSWTLSREPTERERALLRSLYEKSLEEFRADPGLADKLTHVGLSQPPELSSIELAAWTTVARAIFNLNESITRN